MFFGEKFTNYLNLALRPEGRALTNILDLPEDEKIRAFVSLRDFEQDAYLIMTTRSGIIKKPN